MSEEIIIDGVNVAECAYSLVYEQEISCISRLPDVASFNRNPNVAKLNVCEKNSNCYFKQLKRLEQELDIKEKMLDKFMIDSGKTLEKLQQENKKLKEVTNEVKIEYENLLINRNDFAERAYKLEQENKELKAEIDRQKETIIYLQNYDMCHKTLIQYEKALEETKKTILNYKSKEWNCFNDMDIKIEKISEILDEALNDRD